MKPRFRPARPRQRRPRAPAADRREKPADRRVRGSASPLDTKKGYDCDGEMEDSRFVAARPRVSLPPRRLRGVSAIASWAGREPSDRDGSPKTEMAPGGRLSLRQGTLS